MPPRMPASPLPLMRMREPSSTPAGMRTWSVFSCSTRPRPRHVGHGDCTIWPSPAHLVQVVWVTNWPERRLAHLALDAAAPQRSQGTISVPGSAPLPLQVAQVERWRNAISRVVPAYASSSVISTS